MAKKKSASTTKSKSAARPKPPRQYLFSNIGIGDVAGEIWQLLTDQGESSLAAIKKSIDAPADLVLAAVGWLAREDKLEFKHRGRSVKVSLK